MDPELVADIDNCKWDTTTQTLRTPRDEENEKQKSIDPFLKPIFTIFGLLGLKSFRTFEMILLRASS